MNKALLLALPLLGLPSLACADTILGLYAGIGQWHLSLNGDVSSQGNAINLDELGIDDETGTQMWANFEHPIPLIPNLRVMHSSIATQSSSTVNRELSFGNANFVADVRVDTDMDLSHTDGTLYYEILDNWLTLDVGVTARLFDGHVTIESELEGQEGSAQLSGIVPMLYLNAQFELPFSGWSIGAFGNTASYRGDHITDLSAKVGYEFELIPLLLDVGINVGYRLMSLETSEIDDLFADAELSGMYAELQVHF